jgi:hypothetical protein
MSMTLEEVRELCYYSNLTRNPKAAEALLQFDNCNSCSGRIMGKNPDYSMAFKRNLVLSLLLGIGGGLAAYALAWGLFTTHPELGMEVDSARSIAAWTAPLFFVGSLIYFAVRER